MNFGFMRASPIVSSLMMVVLYSMMFAIGKPLQQPVSA